MSILGLLRSLHEIMDVKGFRIKNSIIQKCHFLIHPLSCYTGASGVCVGNADGRGLQGCQGYVPSSHWTVSCLSDRRDEGVWRAKYRAHTGPWAVYQIGEMKEFGEICHFIWNNLQGSPATKSWTHVGIHTGGPNGSVLKRKLLFSRCH